MFIIDYQSDNDCVSVCIQVDNWKYKNLMLLVPESLIFKILLNLVIMALESITMFVYILVIIIVLK